VYSTDQGVEEIPLGLYLVKGDMVYVPPPSPCPCPPPSSTPLRQIDHAIDPMACRMDADKGDMAPVPVGALVQPLYIDEYGHAGHVARAGGYRPVQQRRPAALGSASDHRADQPRRLSALLLLQGAFTFCIAAVLMVGAPTIIHMLAGPKFEQSVPVLRLLAPIPFLVGLANVFGIQLMLPLGMHRMFSRITTAAALLDLLIVVPLSWYFGAPGTAAAALVTEGFVVVTMGVVLIRADVPLFQAPRAGLRA
ncbi:hypothetical protein E4T56_gene8828, partial [Termitomyces sp. T112]